MVTIPDKPSLEGLEAKWRARWEAEGTYRFDRTKSRDEIFSIDTPPPTVSGTLHPGHVCSYSHTDMVARYQRMRGREVFYPMGWDDNGLNVERRVQLMKGVQCDPSLPYDPDFTPPTKVKSGDRPIHISRPNFVEICEEVVEELEQSYFDLWSTVGLSVDWTQTYTTIGPKATRVSQRAFLRLLDRDLVYRSGAPTLWDVDMRTAVAQAELEDREVPGAYHKLRFTGPDGNDLFIDTTRPELLPACVAVVAHPDDERYQPVFGKTATTALFGVEVPIVAHELAQPDKGTGIAMICTFGDTTDVIWWRELGLPIRAVLRHDGRFDDATFGTEGWESVDPERANAAYGDMAGKTVFSAQKAIVERLMAEEAMEGEPRPIMHPVKFWENGKKALEIVTSNQWFVRYPSTDEMIAHGKELNWVPEFMRVRFEDWANGLQGDWNITRQRFFGVPFPVWYPIGDDGEIDFLSPITASEDMLPVDPTTMTAPGYDESQRNVPGGFAADPDVMDTWNTLSMTPQIACGWEEDDDLFGRTYPMDLRPQAHEIIRTWLFSTVVKANYLFGDLPFATAAISGFVVDPDRKKLSKSAGNTQKGPVEIIEEFGADGVRYWAAQARPGMDLAQDEGQMKIGRRLAIKLLNASKFTLGLGGDSVAGASGATTITAPLDRSMLLRLAGLVDEATKAFDAFDYARAVERAETFFWSFTDDHLELVKGRAYGSMGDEAAASAQASLRLALETLLKLFAPFLPFATEEVWSWWQEGSIHRSAWPSGDALREAAGEGDPALSAIAADVLTEIRRAKSEAKASMRADVAQVKVFDTADRLAALATVADDVTDAGKAAELTTEESDTFQVEVTLA